VTERWTWDAEVYARNSRFVSDLASPLVELLAARPGERILDLGCGDGVLTRHLMDLGCDVLGVDASEEMVSAARARGVEARVVDASILDFDNEFDAVFSNAVLHWVQNADAAIVGVRRALKTSGRFVGEFGGAGNVEILRHAMHQALIERGMDPDRVDPWYFPTPEIYRSKLEQNGFEVRHIELIDRPTPLPTGIRGWMESFAGSFVFALPEADREQFIEAVTGRVEGQLFRDGQYFADYVRLRFVAQKIIRSED